MSVDLILFAALVSIALFILIMRTNVSVAIMGLCAGYVFSDLLSDELVSLVFTNFSSASSVPVVSAVSIALILLPALLILFRFKKAQSGRFFQHLIPAVGFSMLTVLFIFTNLPLEAVRYLRDESIIFQQFELFEVAIAAGVVGIAVVDVVIHDGEHRRKYAKKHKD